MSANGGASSTTETEGEAQKNKETALKQAHEVVEQLYRFNTHYFEDHSVEYADRKQSDVKEKMQDALTALESLKELLPREMFSYLKGRTLNVLSEHNQEAENLLASAVKKDPSLSGAWVCLGESYWKKGNVQQAHDCFTSSLNHRKSKEALRSLSMVLRQMGSSPAEREERVRESVERAKEAVTEDIKDGTSWMILGNAYMSLFFTIGSDSKLLKQSMSAYQQAEKDSGTANNPDLHYNRATLCLYEENYETALLGFRQACALDPGWSAPRDKMTEATHFLHGMTHSVSSKGKMKSKKAATLFAPLSSPDKFTKSLLDSKRLICISELIEGSNHGSILVGGVSAIVPTASRVPYACSLVDNAGLSVGLTIYNLGSSTHFNIGDIITVPDPVYKHVHLEKEKVEFGSIRCSDPRLILLNGEKLSLNKLATAVITLTNLQ